MQVTRLRNTILNKNNAKTTVQRGQVGFKEPNRIKFPADDDKRR